jgi:hypothetical protein
MGSCNSFWAHLISHVAFSQNSVTFGTWSNAWEIFSQPQNVFFFLLLNGSAPIHCDWDAKSYRKTQGRYAVKSNNRLVTWMSKWRKVESGASQSNKRVSNVTLSPGSTKHPTSQHEPQSRPFRGPSVRGSIINCHTKMWCLDEFDPNLTLSVKRYENGRVKKKCFVDLLSRTFTTIHDAAKVATFSKESFWTQWCVLGCTCQERFFSTHLEIVNFSTNVSLLGTCLPVEICAC